MLTQANNGSFFLKIKNDSGSISATRDALCLAMRRSTPAVAASAASNSPSELPQGLVGSFPFYQSISALPYTEPYTKRDIRKNRTKIFEKDR